MPFTSRGPMPLDSIAVRAFRPPLGQHGHHTLTPRREPLLGQLRAAHGMRAGNARDKWQGHAVPRLIYHTILSLCLG